MNGISSPLQSQPPFYVLVETTGSRAEHDQEKIEAFLGEAIESGTVVDGTIAAGVVSGRGGQSGRVSRGEEGVSRRVRRMLVRLAATVGGASPDHPTCAPLSHPPHLVSRAQGHMQTFWNIREGISSSIAKAGAQARPPAAPQPCA